VGFVTVFLIITAALRVTRRTDMCGVCINDTGGKFATNTAGVVDTGGKFITGVNNTGSK
jgi:hypothetical protein